MAQQVAVGDPVTEADLVSTDFIDADHPDVVAFAEDVIAGCVDDRSAAVALFEAVRDGIRYDPYDISADPEDYRASAILGGSQRWCVPKSVLLTAAARAVDIPARLGFADVRNHLQSERLLETMGTDLFAWHGYSVLWVQGEWHKASTAFNRELCERFGTKVLEFDGRSDAVLHPHDEAGNRHMEYAAERGIYTDLPLEEIFATFAEVYPTMLDGDSAGAPVHDDLFHPPAVARSPHT